MNSIDEINERLSAATSTMFAKSNTVSVAGEINELHRRAMRDAQSAVQWAIDCGTALLRQKGKLQHGDFQSWCEKNLEFKYSTAVRYMKAAKQKSTGVDFSCLSQLYAPKVIDHAASERARVVRRREERNAPTITAPEELIKRMCRKPAEHRVRFAINVIERLSLTPEHKRQIAAALMGGTLVDGR